MSQYIVAAFLDGTLNVRATGPFRSFERAGMVCDRINDAGEWSVERDDMATHVAQVVPLEPWTDLVSDATEPEWVDQS